MTTQGQGRPPTRPRPAASVILVQRPRRVYMTGRPERLRVAPGFYVFPGGRAEPQDDELVRANPGLFTLPGLDEGHGAYVAAVVRELFEEVGLLLAKDAAGRPLWLPPEQAQDPGVNADATEPDAVNADVPAALVAARNDLNAGRRSFPEILAAHRWTVAVDELAYVSRWVTPPSIEHRFDTRFFVADVTGCVPLVPYAAEVADGVWMDWDAVLDAYAGGTLPLMRPTKALLQELTLFPDADALFAHFRSPGATRAEIVIEDNAEALPVVARSRGVFPVPVPSPTLPPATTTNVYVVAHEGVAVLIDAGHGGADGVARVRRAWHEAGRPRVKALVLTHSHPDHAGGARALMREFSCPLWAHGAATDVLRDTFGLSIDRVLRDGEDIVLGREPGATPKGGLSGPTTSRRPTTAHRLTTSRRPVHLRVIHTPGHAPDHLCFLLRERRTLFSGDNVVGEGSTWVGPPDGDMTTYLHSLERLRRLDAWLIAPGHGPLLDRPARRITQLIRRRLAREADILERLATEGPRTVAELTAALYGDDIPGPVVPMARATVKGHLLKLAREGRARRKDGGGDGRWSI